MPDANQCPDCGAEIPPGQPKGLCPRCALKGALELSDEDSASTAAIPGVPEAGDHIARYKLLQQIGEGGCGVVFMAEQEEPIRRKVALKVIKLGMDTKAVIARFEAERQALALMDHPNIAKVFDAGATETGRPYFVMELVRGVRITDYCDQHNLTTRARLDLFTQVCHAIQHAHQKGIIHRDIKPSNILVTLHDGVPVPKVIDFGIAKATSDQRLTDKTLFTAFEQFMGTPAYMSPEQAEMSGLDIDTRSDIYSLGVLLYELLTGKTPFDGKQLLASGLDAMRRTIREVEPQRPSTRLSTMQAADLTTVAKHRQTEASKLSSLIDGDLDWIVMKALEKDRTRRYDNANGLAVDIQRHLNNEPVIARPPGKLYRFEKLVRRNKLAFAAAAAIAAALLLGLTFSSWQYFEKNRAYDRVSKAEREQSRLREAAEKNAKGESLQRQRTEATVARLEIERADNFLAQGDTPRALAYLARLLRQKPGDRVVAERVMSALSDRNLSLPVVALRHDPPLPSTSAFRTNASLWQSQYAGSITAGEFSPDGQCVVTASKDGTARLWDSHTAQPLCPPLRHRAEVLHAAFSPDGRQVITVSMDHTARLWKASAGEPIFPEFPHDGPVVYADFSRDGKKIATASLDKAVRIWDTATGRLVCQPLTNESRVYFVSFSADGRRVMAITHSPSKARVWDSNTGAEVAAVPAGFNVAGPPTFAQLSGDGAQIFTTRSGGGSNYAGQVWDISGAPVVAMRLTHLANLYSIHLSLAGDLVATASDDTTARVWDARTGKPMTGPLQHEDWVTGVHFSGDGQRLVTTSRDRTARVWDVLSGTLLTEPLRHESAVRLARLSPDGQRVLTFSDGNTAWVWDLRVAQPLTLRDAYRNHARHARFSRDGQRVATATWNGEGRVWEAKTGISVFTYPGKGELGYWAEFSPDGRRVVFAGSSSLQIFDIATGSSVGERFVASNQFTRVRFSSDGQRLVYAGYNGAGILEVSTGRRLIEFNHEGFSVNGIDLSPDERCVATASSDHSALVWDANKGQPITPPLLHEDKVAWVEFSPDGQRIVTGSKDKTARTWNAHTGQLLTKMMHADELYTYHSVQFSPEGKRVVTAAGNAAQVWDADSGKPMTPPIKHNGRVNSVRFSPDGQRIVTSCYDGIARVWDAATGLPLSEPLRHDARVSYAEFSPDGTRVVTASVDRTARLWDLPPMSLPVPRWLSDLAEAAIGERMDVEDVTVSVPVEEMFKLRQRLGESSGQTGYERWARWFLAPSATRTLSPMSPVTVPEIVPRLIEESSLGSLQSAVRLAPTNTLALARLAKKILELPVEERPRRQEEAEFLLRRATALAPDSAEVASVRRAMLESEAGR